MKRVVVRHLAGVQVSVVFRNKEDLERKLSKLSNSGFFDVCINSTPSELEEPVFWCRSCNTIDRGWLCKHKNAEE